LLLALVSGCTSAPGEPALAAGCAPPAHEDELLAAYRADPVFAARPPEALPNGDPQAEKGCLRVSGGESIGAGKAARPAPPPPG
jgi:hypothetical protein